MMIASVGYASTFFWFGLIQGGIIFLVAWLLQGPLPHEVPPVTSQQGRADDRELSRRVRC